VKEMSFKSAVKDKRPGKGTCMGAEAERSLKLFQCFVSVYCRMYDGYKDVYFNN